MFRTPRFRGRASDFWLREPGFESCAAVIKPWASFCSNSFNCRNEYLTIGSGGYVYKQPSRVICCIWLDVSQRNRIGVRVNMYVREERFWGLDSALYKNLPLFAVLCSGNDLQDFYIKVGPYRGEFGSCGFDNNTLPSDSVKTFGCNPNAKGSALEISLLGNIEQYMALCEVLVYGSGEDWGHRPYRKNVIDMLERKQRI